MLSKKFIGRHYKNYQINKSTVKLTTFTLRFGKKKRFLTFISSNMQMFKNQKIK